MYREHAFKVSDRAMNCWSNMADYNYILFIKDPAQMDKALDIADRELSIWGNTDAFPQDEYDYYYNAGYGEVVENALELEGIQVLCYEDIDDEKDPEEYLDKESDIFSNYIARELNAFLYNFDTYEYRDTVDNVDDNIAQIKRSLEEGQTKDIKEYLTDIVKEQSHDNIYSLEAYRLLNKIADFESLKAAEQKKLAEESKAMSQFLGRKLLPRRGR